MANPSDNLRASQRSGTNRTNPESNLIGNNGTTQELGGLFNTNQVRPRPSNINSNQDSTVGISSTIRRNDPTILNEDNFAIWKWSLKYNLKSLGLYESLINPSNATQEQWDAAMFEIISTISDKVKIKVAHCRTPRDLYEAIETLYVNKTSFQVTDLHMRLASFKFTSTQHISDGLSKIQNIVSKLKNLNEPVSDHLVEGIILKALPESFRIFITVWKGLNSSERTLPNLMNRLLAEVEDNKIFENKQNRALMANCDKKEPKGQVKPSKKYSKSKGQNSVKKCSNCNKNGHIEDDCWELHPEKKNKHKNENNKKNNKNKADKSKNAKHITYMAITDKKELPITTWIADSGASNHMTYNKEWFHIYQRFKTPRKIQCSNGSFIPAEGKGVIRTKQGDLVDVFYVPDIAANLFSISAAMNHGLSSMMTKTSIKIYRDLVKIHEGEAMNGTYVLSFDIIVTNTTKAFITRTLQDWHNRLGHISNNVIKEMAKKKTVDGLHINTQDQEFTCNDCLLNKGASSSHPVRTTSKINKPGVCLHIDTAGPMRTLGLYGERFFVLAKDEATSYRKVVCIETKTEIPPNVKLLINQVEMETKNRVMKIVTDNGSEFVNHELMNFFKSKGITHVKTATYTPQQNGFIEREMRTIGESTRTMLNKSGMPHSLWPEAVKTATYVLNRVTTSRDSDSTPYEKWFGRKPNLKNIRIFGQRAVVNRPIPYRDGKWDLTGDIMWFVGYGERYNTYRFFSKEKDAVIESCDVTFIDKSLEPEIMLAERKNSPNLQVERVRPTVPSWLHKQNNQDIQSQQKDNNLSSDDDSEACNRSWSDCSEGCDLEDQDYCEPDQGHNRSRDEGLKNMRKQLTKASEEQDMVIAHNDSQDFQEEMPGLDETMEESFTSAQNDGDTGNEVPKNLLIRGQPPVVYGKRTRSQNLALNSSIMKDEDPKDYKDVMGRDDRSKWLAAMKDEMASLAKNKVWTFVNRPKGVNIVTNRWVLKIKRKPDGSVDRYRARLVARGFSQVQGLDYNETYAPVVNMTSVRLLFSYAITQLLYMKQFDVKTAFLYGNLDETVYMEQPEGFKDGTSKVCLLKKSLYGLKQAPRQWNKEFSNFLKERNLQESQHDRCIFYRTKPTKIFIAIYVDDGLIFAEKESEIDSILNELKRRFEIHEVETPIFLGFQIDYDLNKKQAILHQESYVQKVVERFRMNESTIIPNPSTTSKNTLAEQQSAPLSSNTPYREAIGSLLYAANITRCDIAYAVNRVSRKVATPTTFDWQNVKRILRYLKGDKMSLRYSKESNKGLVAYCDSDFAGDESSKSTTGFIINYGGAPIQWKSQKQALVSLSSTEAELVSICSTVKELTWIRNLAQELGIINEDPTVIYCDNQSAIHLALDEKSVQRTRHMGVRAAFTREQVASKQVEVRHIKTENQLADFLTKPLSNGRFTTLRNKLMFMMSLISLITLSHGYNFEDTKPIIWMPTDNYVDGGITEYEVIYTYLSPCISLQDLFITHDGDHNHQLHLNGNQQSDVRSRIARQANTQTKSQPILPSHQPVHGVINQPFVVNQIPPIVSGPKPSDILIGQMIAECDRAWDFLFIELIREWPMRKKFYRLEPHTRHTRSNDNQELDQIVKRSGIEDLAFGVLKSFGKGILGGVVSNLISTVFSRLNPYSDHNQLKSTKHELETLKNDFKRNFNISHEVHKGLINGLQQLGVAELQDRYKLDFLINMMPKISWTSSFIQTRIMATTADLRVIIDEYAHGRVAIREMANLLNIQELKDRKIAATEFVSMEVFGHDMIRLVFKVMETSNDSFIYKVNPFVYWENLTDTPTLMEYRGSDYLIFNQTSNCMKAIDKPSQKVVDETCLTTDYIDPKLQIWKPITRTREIENMLNETCNIKKTLEYNYIYCFPYEIKIEGESYRMPPNAFRLSSSIGFEIPGKLNFTPKKSFLNITKQSELPVIDMVHVGHFPNDSEVINTNQWFAKIQNLHKLNDKLHEEEEKSIMITKYSITWWISLLTVIAWIKLTLFLGFVNYRNGTILMNNSSVRYSATQSYQTNQQASQQVNQEISLREKPRLEVGRDESITINLNQTLPLAKNFSREGSL